jgi:hypothetical protein
MMESFTVNGQHAMKSANGGRDSGSTPPEYPKPVRAKPKQTKSRNGMYHKSLLLPFLMRISN